MLFGFVVVDVDTCCPCAAGWEVPGKAGQGHQLVKLPGRGAAVPCEVKPAEGVAEDVYEGYGVGNVLPGVLDADEGQLVQGLAGEGPWWGAIRASLVARVEAAAVLAIPRFLVRW